MNKKAGYLLPCILAARMMAAASDTIPQGEPAAGTPLTLAEAVRMAIAHAPEVSLAEAQTERATEALRETRATNLPQVVAGTGLAYNNGFPLSMEGSAPSAFQVGLSQSIFSKRNKNLILEAQEGIKSTRIGTESARGDLTARTILVYYDLHQARRMAALCTDRLEASAKEQKATEALLEAGKLKPLDAVQVRTAVEAARYQLLVAGEQARLAETELRLLTGLPPDSQIRTEEPQLDPQILGAPADALYQKALESQPDIRQAESSLRGKEFHVEAEKSGKYPRFELISEYALFARFNNYQDYFNKFTRNNYLVGMTIQVPVFDGFTSSSRVAQSRQEVTEARLRLERLKTDLKLNIERVSTALRIARGAAELAKRELEAAAETFKLTQTLLEGGRISPSELAKATSQLRDKEIAVVEADKVTFQRQVELLRITGSLTSMF